MQIKYRYELCESLNASNLYKYININKIDKTTFELEDLSAVTFSTLNPEWASEPYTSFSICYNFMLHILNQTKIFDRYSMYVLYSDDYWTHHSRITSYKKLWKRQKSDIFEYIERKCEIEVIQGYQARYAGILELPQSQHDLYASSKFRKGRVIYSPQQLCETTILTEYDTLLQKKYKNDYYRQVLNDDCIIMSPVYDDEYTGMSCITLLLKREHLCLLKL